MWIKQNAAHSVPRVCMNIVFFMFQLFPMSKKRGFCRFRRENVEPLPLCDVHKHDSIYLPLILDVTRTHTLTHTLLGRLQKQKRSRKEEGKKHIYTTGPKFFRTPSFFQFLLTQFDFSQCILKLKV